MERESIDRIYWNAAQIASPNEREAYLQNACGDDAELRRRVEQLLQARTGADALFESPAATLAAFSEPLGEGPGSVIGPYKLMEQIGEGGMGLVFVAEQHQVVRRRVALKVIKPGMDSREVIARFEAERQALALMDHHRNRAVASVAVGFVLLLAAGASLPTWLNIGAAQGPRSAAPTPSDDEESTLADNPHMQDAIDWIAAAIPLRARARLLALVNRDPNEQAIFALAHDDILEEAVQSLTEDM